MKLLVLYRPDTEHERKVLDFSRDFKSFQPDRKIELVSLNTREGAALAQLYDAMSYPAILALTNDGQLLQSWGGEPLPLMNEVAYYQDR